MFFAANTILVLVCQLAYTIDMTIKIFCRVVLLAVISFIFGLSSGFCAEIKYDSDAKENLPIEFSKACEMRGGDINGGGPGPEFRTI